MAGGWRLEAGPGTARCLTRLTTLLLTASSQHALVFPMGRGRDACLECGDLIPQARRRAMPRAVTCVFCQSGRDARIVAVGINRRGSKGSQLR